MTPPNSSATASASADFPEAVGPAMTMTLGIEGDRGIRCIRIPFPGWRSVGHEGEAAMATLKHKVALVTGSGRGLGRAIAQLFAREGAKVVVATVTPENGAETVKLIQDAGGEASFVQTDVAKSADVQRMVQHAI